MADKKKTDRKAGKGNALLAAPDGVTGCSVDGEEYQVDADGLVEVAAAHAATLVDRGFVAV